MFKKINWKNIGLIFLVAVVAILTAPIWLPPVKAVASKIPFVGDKLA